MTIETLGVLESVSATVPLWRQVRIDADRLRQVCAGIAPESLALPAWDFPSFVRTDPATLAGQILLFNSINFCYWGEPKWQVEYLGQTWGGTLGLLMAMRRALEEGLPTARRRLPGWTIGDSPSGRSCGARAALHLMPERLAIWRAVGEVLVREFGGSFTVVIEAAGGDAPTLAGLLIERFPSFDDRRDLDGRPVRFYKRAQLAAAMLFEASGGRGWGRLARTDQLTVFADYKLPQVLRRLGILVYAPELAAIVDHSHADSAGDRREVEIRAATVWAAELMRQVLAARIPEITALHLDYWLWAAGRAQGPELQTYHRTLTTSY